jgi:hypothetical protein
MAVQNAVTVSRLRVERVLRQRAACFRVQATLGPTDNCFGFSESERARSAGNLNVARSVMMFRVSRLPDPPTTRRASDLTLTGLPSNGRYGRHWQVHQVGQPRAHKHSHAHACWPDPRAQTRGGSHSRAHGGGSSPRARAQATNARQTPTEHPAPLLREGEGPDAQWALSRTLPLRCTPVRALSVLSSPLRESHADADRLTLAQ